MKFGVIIAARSNSKRLPGKATLPLIGTPILQLLIKRVKTSKIADKIILATSDLSQDDGLEKIAKEEGIEIFRGPLDNVLGRFVGAAKKYDFDYCVRITGDEPFLDGQTLDYVIEKAK
jgi:spore coat polysaccharide biosynthesis protein SpsF